MKGRYEVSQVLGKGGVGEVLLAQDKHLKRQVAIKRLHAEVGDEAAEALMTEATTLSSLNHPNIVTVHDVGIDEEGAYVVMEYLEGETFEELVSRGALTWEDFQSVAIQTLEGMIAAQHHGLIHRDIKPGNLMVIWRPSGSFAVKLLDFGLAKFSPKPSKQTVDQGDAIMGSIYFMAPEQFERGELDGRTDLYSLGAVFYYGLTGHYPFDGETAAGVMAAHLSHSCERLDTLRPDVPLWACEWVHWMMRRHLEERPSDASNALQVFVRQGEGLPRDNATTRRLLTASGRVTVVPGSATSRQTSSVSSSMPAHGGTTAPNTVRPEDAGKQHALKVPKAQMDLPASRKILVWGGSILGAIIAIILIIWLVNSGGSKEQKRINELISQGSEAETKQVAGSESDFKLLYPLLAGGYSEGTGTARAAAEGRAATQTLSKLEWPGTDQAVRDALGKETNSNTIINLTRIAMVRGVDGLSGLIISQLGSLDSDTKAMVLGAVREQIEVQNKPLSKDQFQALLDDFLKEDGSAAVSLLAVMRVAIASSENPQQYESAMESAVRDASLEGIKRGQVWSLAAETGSEGVIEYLSTQVRSGNSANQTLAVNALGKARGGMAAEFLSKRALNTYKQLSPNATDASTDQRTKAHQALQAAMEQASKADPETAHRILESAIQTIDDGAFIDPVVTAIRLRSEDWAVDLVDELIARYPKRSAELSRIKIEIGARGLGAGS